MLIGCRFVLATAAGFAFFASGPARAAEGQPAQGLVLTIEGAHANATPAFPDARIARLVALYAPQGSAPSVFTRAGPFRATFEGELNQRLRGYVNFSAEGRGKLTVTINDKRVLEVAGDDFSKTLSPEIRLNKGKNHIVVVYDSPDKGDAAIRLFWSSKTWRPEPVPPMVFTHLTSDATARSLQVREGRALLAQFRCIRCHASPLSQGKDRMPELEIDAPELSDAGARFNREWLAAWISNPRNLRAGAHMPRLFTGNDIDPRAKDIAAYLAKLGSPGRSPAPAGDATSGGRIFANLDCLACHTTPDGKDDPSRVPLSFVTAKYKPRALREYLLNPAAHYTSNPMPDFRLMPAEANDLAAFLLSTSRRKPDPVSGGDAARGKELIASAGCLNCHAIGSEKSTARFPTLSALAKGNLDKGCLAIEAGSRGTAPDFALAEEQRAALAAFLETDRASLARRCAPEFAERQIAAMRCTACHARDGRESLLAQELDAESQALHEKYPNPPPRPGELLAADQRPPILTWAGEKLRPDWMAKFIAGKLAYKPRDYLRARMPSFGARAELLASGLAEEHGCPPVLPPNSKPDLDQSETGRRLCSKVANAGFSCVQCHAVAGVPPFAAFEAPSIDLAYVSERLRHDYYTRWMRDPLRVDPNTKMPRFDDAQGKTAIPTYGGDATRQFQAIWQYLLEGQNIKPPPQ